MTQIWKSISFFPSTSLRSGLLTTISNVDLTQQNSRHNFERLFEIRDDILDILNPYRHLHQISPRHYH